MMDRYPDFPGWQEQETSRQAAIDFYPKAKTVRDRVLNAIRSMEEHGATPPEISKRLELPIISVQPRFTELKLKGLIFDSGQRRLSEYGKKQIVWVCVGIKME